MSEDQAQDDPGDDRHRRARHQPPLDVAGSQPVTTREAAAVLGVSERTIRRAIANGELTAVKGEGAYHIDRESLDRLAARTERPSSARPLARVVAFPGAIDVASLPEPLSSFVGRGADVASVLALLDDPAARLITLTGPGGIGKTRLSMAAASALDKGRFPDGVAFVPLADVQRPRMVMPAIARALGLRERPGQNQTDQLRAFLRRKQLLLVLDNFEHLLPAGSEVAALLTEAVGIKALITSRAALRVMGERDLPVQPMRVASNNATPMDLLASDAGRLFVERASEHDPSFRVDEDSAPLIADICAQLDGLPLAIELAAARVKVLPPHQIHARLKRRLPLLTRGARNAPARHSTMRDAIAWSYELLSPEEQRAFRRLAVFSGGATLEAAEYVGGDASLRGSRPTGLRGNEDTSGRIVTSSSSSLSPLSEASPPERSDSPFVIDTIASLTEQSLLTVETGLDGERRFRMLETIREFGLERLAAAGEEVEARAALAGYMLALVSSFGAPELLAANKRALDRLEASQAELQAALAWLEGRDPVAFVRLVAMLPSYWYACSHYQEAQEWLERALQRQEQDAVTALDRARLQVGLSRFQLLSGEYDLAAAGLDRGIPVLRAHGSKAEAAVALMWRGGLATFTCDDEVAEATFADACQVAELVDDPRTRATLLGHFLANLAIAARARGDLDLAELRLQRALEQFQAHDNTFAVDGLFLEMGDLALDRADYTLALSHYQTFLERMAEHGDMQTVEAALVGVARVATASGRFPSAARLFAMADTLQQRLGLGMILPSDLAGRERDLATVQAQLGDAAFAVAWSEGRPFSLSAARDEIAALAQPTPSGMAPFAGSSRGVDTLTRRERDVLRLMAEHKSDREIAEALYLSLRTVNWHVRSILGKLEATSRGEAVLCARARGLL